MATSTRPKPQSEASSVDDRVRHLEQTVASIVTHIDNLAGSVGKLVTAVEDVKSEVARSPKPTSVREHLITAATAATVVAGIFAAMNWWFETSYDQASAPLRSTVAQHQQFLDPLRHEGKLYSLFDRVERLERAMKWKPELESYSRLGGIE